MAEPQRGTGGTVALGAGLGACALLCACASPPSTATAGMPPRVAEAAQRAAQAQGAYPRFSDIPKTTPQGLPAVTLGELAAAARALANATQALPPAPADTQAFAARAQAASTLQAPAEDAAREIEAFAAALRARAMPPPPSE